MCTDLGLDDSFYELLQRLDQERANEAQEEGCPWCGGRLHRANYARKPRGGPLGMDPAYGQRLSFCCATDGCRRRVTPPSVRFMGRRVYLAVAVVLCSALHAGQAPRHVTRLRQLLGSGMGPSRRTLAQWLAWWRESLPQSSLWQVLRARLMPPVCPQALPGALLERLELDRNPSSAVVALLRQLSPLTTGSLVTLF